MDSNGGSNFRHRRSPSSDRFHDVFSPKIPSSAVAGDDFDEDDVFWTGDFAEPNRKIIAKKLGFRSSANNGILAALLDSEQNRTLRDRQVHRKQSISSSQAEAKDSLQNRSIRDLQVVQKPSISSSPRFSPKVRSAIPKPSIQTTATMFSQSAPINVPVMSKARSRNGDFADVDDDDDGEEEEMLPPHEIVARERKTTFSVLEGFGRTLKGRDLRQVRNAVWRQTGFLD